MSSPREASQCDGVLEIHDRAVGPIRLPTDSTESFLRRFNEEYGGLGLAIVMAGTLAPAVKPGSATPETNAGIVPTKQASGLQPLAANPGARERVVEHLSKTLAVIFCGTHADRSSNESAGASDGLLSLLDRVSLATANRSLGGATTIVHVVQLMTTLDNGTRCIVGGQPSVVRSAPSAIPVLLIEEHWQVMRQQLADTYHRFASSLSSLDLNNESAMSACFTAVATSGYHFGIIRQKLAFQRAD